MTTIPKKLCVIALLTVSLPAWAELVDRIAAVVNRDIITLSEVEARAAPELQRPGAETLQREPGPPHPHRQGQHQNADPGPRVPPPRGGQRDDQHHQPHNTNTPTHKTTQNTPHQRVH